jgi:peroxiredoxin Q/BCP
MKRILAYALIGGLAAMPALAMEKGATAPDFKARASLAGKEFDFSLKDALKKGPVVVYFYPAAFTKGCNMEAQAFAATKEKFDAAGATVIGVSRDNIQRLNAFSSDPEYCAGKFPVASDADGSIAKSYNLSEMQIPAGANAKDSRGEALSGTLTKDRNTYVITPDNKIVAVLSTEGDKLAPADHAEKSLAVVESLKAAKK